MCNNKNIVEEMRKCDGTFTFNAENIANRIEREFIPRPKFKGGEYVHINDKFTYHGWEHTVKSMEYDEDGWWIFSDNGELFEPCACKYVEQDTIYKVWKDAEALETLSNYAPRLDKGDITSLLQRLEKIIREECKSKEK